VTRGIVSKCRSDFLIHIEGEKGSLLLGHPSAQLLQIQECRTTIKKRTIFGKIRVREERRNRKAETILRCSKKTKSRKTA